jgi:hypothetical protein
LIIKPPSPTQCLGSLKIDPFCEAGHIWTISECCSYPTIPKPQCQPSLHHQITCSQFWHSCRFFTKWNPFL